MVTKRGNKTTIREVDDPDNHNVDWVLVHNTEIKIDSFYFAHDFKQ